MEQHETEAALLPNIANQMRSLLSNLYLAASQVIPPEQREQDPSLDAKAAILEQSFFRLLRLFIRRIEMGERGKKYSRSSGQSVRIFYRNIGAVDSGMREAEKPALSTP